MATLFHIGSYRILIYSNDHSPPHVHAAGEGNAKFELGKSAGDVTLVEQAGVARRDLHRIAEAIAARHEECVAAWERIHGRKR